MTHPYKEIVLLLFMKAITGIPPATDLVLGEFTPMELLKFFEFQIIQSGKTINFWDDTGKDR